MHICFISNEYPLWASGGIGSFLQTFSKALVKEGHKVSIVGIGKSVNKESLNDNGVELHRLPVSKLPAAKFIGNSKQINKEIKRLHSKHKIDIVESAELGLAFVKKLEGVKYVIRLHGGHHFFTESEKRGINKWKGFQEKRSFKKADGFIAVSNYVKNHTAKYLSYHNRPLGIIRSPINTEMFSPKPEVEVDSDTIAFVGTVCEKKGIRQLIEAMGKLRNDFSNLRLNIYGRDWFFKDGSSYIKMLKENYKEVVEDSVIFHGSIPFSDVPKAYAKAMVCVFPSHMETQGLVAQEAMAVERPVVFSELDPGPEIISHFKTGLLCNPYDIDDIVGKISWYLSNKEKANAIGKSAREFVLQKFNIKTILEKNIKFYNSI